jgi:hypothetical protein
MFFFTLLPFFWAGWLSSIPFVRYNDNEHIFVQGHGHRYGNSPKWEQVLYTDRDTERDIDTARDGNRDSDGDREGDSDGDRGMKRDRDKDRDLERDKNERNRDRDKDRDRDTYPFTFEKQMHI